MTPPSLRDAIEQTILLSVGAASLTRDRVEQIIGELVAQGRVSAEDGRVIMDRLIARVVDPRRPTPPGSSAIWRRRCAARSQTPACVTRGEVDDLRVQLAELDHRRVCSKGRRSPPAPARSTPACDATSPPAE